MSSKHKPINRNMPAVLSIITDNSAGLASVILTRRHPSDTERNLADWTEIVTVGGVTCHVVGRGERVTWARLADIAETLLNAHAPHKQGELPSIEAATVEYENAAMAEAAPVMDFGNDPTWKRIMSVAGGAR